MDELLLYAANLRPHGGPVDARLTEELQALSLGGLHSW